MTIDRALKLQREPQQGTVHRLADAFNIRRADIDNYLLGKTSTMPMPGSESASPFPAESTTAVPFYNSVSAATVDQRGDDGVEMAVVSAGSPHRFVTRVDGACMEKLLPAGCMVVCDYDQTARDGIVSGRVYWIRFDTTETTLKRVVVDGDDLVFTCDAKGFPSFRRPASSVAAAALVVQKIEEIR